MGVLSIAPSFAAQETPAPVTSLKVGDDVKTPLSLTPDELKSMPRTQVEVKDEDGCAASPWFPSRFRY